jgi:hypothetical protein
LTGALLSHTELERNLRTIGEERHHHRHPFHHLTRDGKLNRGQVQAWVLNRYYYQARAMTGEREAREGRISVPFGPRCCLAETSSIWPPRSSRPPAPVSPELW